MLASQHMQVPACSFNIRTPNTKHKMSLLHTLATVLCLFVCVSGHRQFCMSDGSTQPDCSQWGDPEQPLTILINTVSSVFTYIIIYVNLFQIAICSGNAVQTQSPACMSA